MKILLIYVIIVIIAAVILIWYLKYEKRTQKQNTQQQLNKRIIDKNPLDNATYIEYHDVQEANRETMLDEILHQWKITNFWLGCIGIVFLLILAGIIASIIFGIQLGNQMNNALNTLTF